jgi:hypothetical protein
MYSKAVALCNLNVFAANDRRLPHFLLTSLVCLHKTFELPQRLASECPSSHPSRTHRFPLLTIRSDSLTGLAARTPWRAPQMNLLIEQILLRQGFVCHWTLHVFLLLH